MTMKMQKSVNVVIHDEITLIGKDQINAWGRIWQNMSRFTNKGKVTASTWLPSPVVMLRFPSRRQLIVKVSRYWNIKGGFWPILSDISCSNFRRKWSSNSSFLWLGGQYRKIAYPFLFWILIFSTGYSSKFRGLSGRIA